MTSEPGSGHARPRRIGMVLYGDLTYDSRVRREARTLALAGHDVTVVCLADESDRRDLPPNVIVRVVPTRDESTVPGALNPFRAGSRNPLASGIRGFSWLRRYVGSLRAWSRSAAVAAGPVEAWHANDLTGLAAIVPVADRAVPVVYDVHDLLLETGTAVRLPGMIRSLLLRYERRLVSRVSAIVTVNAGLAEVLKQRFPGIRIEIVHNCPDRWSPPADGRSPMRAAANIADGIPIVLHHGGLSGGRGIEELMEACLEPGMEAVHLVLLGFGERRHVYAETATEPRWGGRVHVLDAVPPEDLLGWVTSADVGAVLHPGARVNDRLKTPNKLFECLAAGVPVVASDLPIMRQIVDGERSGPLGVITNASRPDEIAIALRSILELPPDEARRLRDRCLAAAHDRWNWEAEAQRLVRLYADLPAIQRK